MLAAREQRPDLKIVVLDPRRTATTRDRRPAPAAARGHRRAPVQRPARSGCAEHGARRQRLRRRAHAAAATHALAAARAGGGDAAGDRARLRTRRRRSCASSTSCSPRTPAVITAFSQGVNQSSAGTDKVNAIINCHLADRPHRQTRRGPVLRDRPAQCDGRPRSRRLRRTRWPRTSICTTSRAARPCRQFWSSPAIASKQGPKAVEMFDRIHAGKIKAVWIMATNPVVSLPDADKVRRRCARCEFVVGLRRHGQHRHGGARARAAAGARLGREGRHGHQLRPHDLAPARRSCRRRAKRAPTGASSATWRAPWASRASISHRRTRFSASTRSSRAHANDGRRALEPRRLVRHHAPRSTRTGSPPPGRWPRRASPRAGPMFADGKFLHRRRHGALPRRSRRACPRTRRRRNIRWCSTPAACATTGTR